MRSSFIGLVFLALLGSTSAVRFPSGNGIPGYYFVELQAPVSGLVTSRSEKSDVAHRRFHKRAAEQSILYQTQLEFQNLEFIHGLSIILQGHTQIEDIEALPGVVRTWPVRQISSPHANMASAAVNKRSETDVQEPTASPDFFDAVPGRGPVAGPDADVNNPHSMTGVDKLHRLGVTGKGVKIAIIDSGVDYRLPALGGCFGPGCKVGFGYDFVGDNYGANGNLTLDPKPNPLTTCNSGGHGTHVSGIVGMLDSNGTGFGLVGVAPDATLGMYRVYSCALTTTSDLIDAAMIKAYEDGANVISMSLGGGPFGFTEQYTPFAPSNAVADDLAAKGVTIIASVGNSADSGLYSAETPASAAGVIAVAAAITTKDVLMYSAVDSKDAVFPYMSVFPIGAAPPTLQYPTANNTGVFGRNSTLRLSVYIINEGNHTGCDVSILAAAAANVTNLETTILGINMLTADCWTIYNPIENAADAGWRYVMLIPPSTGDVWEKRDYGFTPGRAQVMTPTVEGALAIKANALADPDYRLIFHDNIYNSLPRVTGGFIGNFSTYGPNYEGLFKPDIATPGCVILSTWPMDFGGYNRLSGTSMAAPYAAGVAGLLLSQNISLTPSQVRSFLQSTSNQTTWFYDQNVIETAAAQGAGIVDAYSAVMSLQGTVITPGSFSLGDLTQLRSQSFQIINRSPSARSYSLSHRPAGLAQLFPYADITGYDPTIAGEFGTPSLPIYATVDFSTTSVKLEAGEIATVDVTFAPPQLVGDEWQQIPAYSGYIHIDSDLSETFTVSYVGMLLNRTAHPMLEYVPPGTTDATPSPSVTHGAYNTSVNTELDVYTFIDGDFPYINFRIYQPSIFARMDLLPYNTSFVPTYYGYDPSLSLNVTYQYPGSPYIPDLVTYGAGLEAMSAIWDDFDQPPGLGNTNFNGQVYDWKDNFPIANITSGDYRILLRVLKWGGDNNTASDWESWLSPVLRFSCTSASEYCS